MSMVCIRVFLRALAYISTINSKLKHQMATATMTTITNLHPTTKMARWRFDKTFFSVTDDDTTSGQLFTAVSYDFS